MTQRERMGAFRGWGGGYVGAHSPIPKVLALAFNPSGGPHREGWETEERPRSGPLAYSPSAAFCLCLSLTPRWLGE